MFRLLLTIFVLFLLSGCGGGGGSSNSSSPEDTTTEVPTTPDNNDSTQTPTTDEDTDTTTDNSSTDDTKDWFTYLNELRSNSGMTTFLQNSKLNDSSLNHSLYIEATGDYEHLESFSSNSRYTGDYANDRAKFTGYEHSVVGENVANSDSEKDSIDDLFTAIYHRIGFLSFFYDEVGGGNSGGYYTYNMGSTAITTLCQDNFLGSGTYYTSICNNGNRISVNDYTQNSETAQYEKNPDLVVFPYSNATDIPPVFYEESPDPLPNTSMSANPISIHFNPSKSGEVSSISLTNKTTNEVISNVTASEALFMTTDNDPNNKLTNKEYVLFPYVRLDWGTDYEVTINYTLEEVISSKTWEFSTMELANLYVITENSTNINVNSNENFHIYFKLNGGLDQLTGGFSYQYPSTTSDPVVTNIDTNTYKFLINGNSGDKTTINYSGGSFTITLN